jgi:hypothetical protein
MQRATVNISQKTAIARGSVQWGDTPIDLEAVLAELGDEERGWISVSREGRLCASPPGANYPCMLTAPDATTASVAEAVRGELAAARAETAKREKIEEAAIAETELWVTALPGVARVKEEYGKSVIIDATTPTLWHVPDGHPVRGRVKAALSAARVAAEPDRSRRQDVLDRAKKIDADARASRRDAHDAERAEWIEAHGSRRLKLLAGEGMGLAETYRDERLETERPGWRWACDVCGEAVGLRDATEVSLDALVAARETVVGAELVWLRYDDCECTDCTVFRPRAVLTAELLGHEIMREIEEG